METDELIMAEVLKHHPSYAQWHAPVLQQVAAGRFVQQLKNPTWQKGRKSSCHLLIASLMNLFFSQKPLEVQFIQWLDYHFLATNKNGKSPRKSPELRGVGDIYMISMST